MIYWRPSPILLQARKSIATLSLSDIGSRDLEETNLVFGAAPLHSWSRILASRFADGCFVELPTKPRKETIRQDKVSKTAPCITKRGSYRHRRFILESVQSQEEEGCIDDNYTVIPTYGHYKVPNSWTLGIDDNYTVIPTYGHYKVLK